MKKKVFLKQSKTDANTFVICDENDATHYREEDDEISNNAVDSPLKLPTMNFKDSKLEATNPVRFPNDESCNAEFLPLPKQNFSGQADAASQNKDGALQLPKMF